MEPVIEHEQTTERLEGERREPTSLHELFMERYQRLELLEDVIKHQPATPEARQKLAMLRRAKFSTWLDLEALKTAENRAA